MGAMTILLTYPTFLFVRSHRWLRYADRHRLCYANAIIRSTYLCSSVEILRYITAILSRHCHLLTRPDHRQGNSGLERYVLLASVLSFCLTGR